MSHECDAGHFKGRSDEHSDPVGVRCVLYVLVDYALRLDIQFPRRLQSTKLYQP